MSLRGAKAMKQSPISTNKLAFVKLDYLMIILYLFIFKIYHKIASLLSLLAMTGKK